MSNRNTPLGIAYETEVNDEREIFNIYLGRSQGKSVL